jgi:dephospho-CoA kinase
MGRVFAVCGLPGSGKGEFAAVLQRSKIPILSMGDMVRAEVSRRELEESPGIFGIIAAQLRSEFGDDVLAKRLCDAVDELLEDNELILIEGLRGTAEFDLFKSRWGNRFSTIAITSPMEVRFQRIQSRGRSEDGDYAAFEVREKRETGWGLDKLIESADVVLPNDSNLEEFYSLCEDWLEQFQNS